MKVSEEVKRLIVDFQRNEITEYHIYMALAKRSGNKNRDVLKKIAKDELGHYRKWKKYTGVETPPKKATIWKYLLLSRIFGVTFAIKLMEGGEEMAQESYRRIEEEVPEAGRILEDEFRHENLLINMIDEEKLGYISSIVLGLNDALVELTGALAGFTLAMQNSRFIGAAGFITGVAAALSMASSEYLSQKAEAGGGRAKKAALYTGLAYILTVFMLVVPYFLLSNYLVALGVALVDAFFVILVFTFFMAVVKELSFKRTFLEMILLSWGVAGVSFVIGWLARVYLHLEIG